MALRFKDDNLVRDDGTVFEISYEALLKSCLRDSYETVSLKEIIFSAILETTGELAIGNKYRKSSLFNRLEEEIRKNPAYQNAREVQMAKDKEEREKIQLYEASLYVYSLNPIKEQKIREIRRRYYRSSFNR